MSTTVSTWDYVIPIVVALITVGVPAWVSMRKFRHDNTNQHSIVTALLTDVRNSQANLNDKIDERFDRAMDKIDCVQSSLDQHLGSHEPALRLSSSR